MAITFGCPSCGKPLQARDESAGKRVKCPQCATPAWVPTGGEAPTPRAEPVAPPPSRDEPAPDGGGQFDFGGGGESAPAPKRGAFGGRADRPQDPPRRDRAADDRDEDDVPRKRRPWEGAADDDRPPRRSRREDDADGNDRPRRSGRGEPRRSRGGTWAAFGNGCDLAKIGVWIEFGGFALAMLLQLVSALDDGSSRSSGRPLVGDLGVLFPILLGAAGGGGMVWLGRARMLGVPDGTGAKGVFLIGFLVTLARMFGVLGALLMAIMALTAARTDASYADYMRWVTLLSMLGVLLWGVADVYLLPGMALVAGALPGDDLRRRTGTATAVLQGVSALVVIILFTVLAYLMQSALTGPSSTSGGRSGRPRDPGGVNPWSIVLTVVLIGFHALYTAMYFYVYSGAARAARESEEDEYDGF